MLHHLPSQLLELEITGYGVSITKRYVGFPQRITCFWGSSCKKGELGRQYKLWQLRKETISQSPPFHHAYSCEERHSLCLNDPGDSRELKINLHFETLQLQGEQTGEKKMFPSTQELLLCYPSLCSCFAPLTSLWCDWSKWSVWECICSIFIPFNGCMHANNCRELSGYHWEMDVPYNNAYLGCKSSKRGS